MGDVSRILIMKTPRYNKISGSMSPTNRYSWPKDLLYPEETQVKYKGTTGDKQINMRITSTAWNRLQCHSTAKKLSKALIVQSLILSYTPTTEEQRRRNKEYREELNRKYQNNGTYAIPEDNPEHWNEENLDEFGEMLIAYDKMTKSAVITANKAYGLPLRGKKTDTEKEHLSQT